MKTRNRTNRPRPTGGTAPSDSTIQRFNDATSPRRSVSTHHKIAQSLSSWFAANARDLPWRRTRDPYAIWVSEIMLQQTQVKTVIPFFEHWMAELPGVEALAAASPERLHKLWEGLGYYTRVRNMQRAAVLIQETYGGVFPREFDRVIELPGVGRYTAGAICSIAFNQPTPIVDGNVVRVLTRLFGIRENTRDKETIQRLWDVAGRLVQVAAQAEAVKPRQRGLKLSGPCSVLNQAVMELGAVICTPREPKCGECPVWSTCAARKAGLVGVVPNLGERAAATERRFVAAVVSRDGQLLVRQRPAGVVNAHLWEFPNVEVPLRAAPRSVRKALETELGCVLDLTEPLVTIRHSITRYRIALEVVRAVPGQSHIIGRAGEWKAMSEIEALAFTSAHRKAVRSFVESLNRYIA